MNIFVIFLKPDEMGYWLIFLNRHADDFDKWFIKTVFCWTVEWLTDHFFIEKISLQHNITKDQWIDRSIIWFKLQFLINEKKINGYFLNVFHMICVWILNVYI